MKIIEYIIKKTNFYKNQDLIWRFSRNLAQEVAETNNHLKEENKHLRKQVDYLVEENVQLRRAIDPWVLMSMEDKQMNRDDKRQRDSKGILIVPKK